MAYKLTVDPRIFKTHPTYNALVIYASNLAWNHPEAVEYSLATLREAELDARLRFGDSKPESDPHVGAWRAAFKEAGINPNRFPNSAEALLKRILKGRDLPSINAGVNLYNAVSVKHAIPVGGENWDAIVSDLRLTYAEGDEDFDVIEREGQVVGHPEPNEPIWRDAAGATCRKWNYRQSHRTRLTEVASRAYFVLDRLYPLPMENLVEAGQELMAHMKYVSSTCSLEYDILHASNETPRAGEDDRNNE